MRFSLVVLDLAVTQAAHPEVLRDIILAIFDQMRLRLAMVYQRQLCPVRRDTRSAYVCAIDPQLPRNESNCHCQRLARPQKLFPAAPIRSSQDLKPDLSSAMRPDTPEPDQNLSLTNYIHTINHISDTGHLQNLHHEVYAELASRSLPPTVHIRLDDKTVAELQIILAAIMQRVIDILSHGQVAKRQAQYVNGHLNRGLENLSVSP